MDEPGSLSLVMCADAAWRHHGTDRRGGISVVRDAFGEEIGGRGSMGV